MSRPVHILAIDDSLTIRKLLDLSLSKLGYQLELAVNGSDGISRAIRRHPDLILLDYVMPDMKGIDVCAALQIDEHTRSIPIIIMSAKSDDIKSDFKDFPNVVEFVNKPFTPREIKFHIASAIGQLTDVNLKLSTPVQPPAQSEAAAVQFSPAQKESAARIIFSKLRERFQRIPELSAQLGTADPGLFYGRKILTPTLMDSILSALVPILVPNESAPAAGEIQDQDASVTLSGKTHHLNVIGLIKLIISFQRTGVLELDQSGNKSLLYIRRGELIFVSNNRPEDYVNQASFSLEKLPRADVLAAETAHRKSGKPIYVTLAESGKIPNEELKRLLFQQGMQVLMEAVEAGPGTFQWIERGVLPPYVEVHGKVYSVDYLNLELLRKVDDWAQIEMRVDSLDAVFERSPGFNSNHLPFELTDKERRVLTVVDRRNSVNRIIERTGLTPFDVFHVLFCMSHVNLVRKLDVSLANGGKELRKIMFADREPAQFEEPFAEALRQRRGDIQLLNVSAEPHIADRCLKERPAMVVLADGTPGVELNDVAQRIRSVLEISDTPLIALLEADIPEQIQALMAAGFTAVIVKPVGISDLLRLMAA